jgi:hypothetical protein
VRAVIYGSREIRTIAALALGLSEHGWTFSWREDRDAYQARQEPLQEFDLAVTDGIRGPMGVMCREAEALEVPVLIADAAFVRRDLNYFQLSINRLNWIPEFDLPGDRWDRLEVELQPRHAGDFVLVTGQKPGDAAHGLSTFELREKYQDWYQELRKYTERPVLFRPHPMGLEVHPRGLQPSSGRSLPDELAAAHALVTWNSTTATDALIAGTPAFVLGPNAQVDELANSELELIESPFFPDPSIRRALFHRIAYSQWTLDELQDGSALEFTLAAMERQGLNRKARL